MKSCHYACLLTLQAKISAEKHSVAISRASHANYDRKNRAYAFLSLVSLSSPCQRQGFPLGREGHYSRPLFAVYCCMLAIDAKKKGNRFTSYHQTLLSALNLTPFVLRNDRTYTRDPGAGSRSLSRRAAWDGTGHP